MMNWINKKKNKKGFTLIELVVVIAILGILAAIAVPKLSKSRESATNATDNANMRILKSAATMYLADNPTITGITLTDSTNLSEFAEYFDSGELPTPFDTTKSFKVEITKTGDIEVSQIDKSTTP